MATCKGHKMDGTPCQSPIVMPNGYCFRHQDQSQPEPALPAPEPTLAGDSCGDIWRLLICLAGGMALALCVVALIRRLWRALQD